MKKYILILLVLINSSISFTQKAVVGEVMTDLKSPQLQRDVPPVQNLFIITLDGFRWQELFGGADAGLINDNTFTPENETIKKMYWAETPEERRKKLMPFLWNVVGVNGQVYGNRAYENNVNVSNDFAKSYPGYNEIFTGMPDREIVSNKKINNQHVNVLEYLNGIPSFQNKVVAFTSWDVFPFILNENRSGILINSGYDPVGNDSLTEAETLINKTEQEGVVDKSSTRYDQLTFLVAKEYIRAKHPRVVFLGLGETDEYAHQGRYDLYLGHASQADNMLADLWHWVQTTPGYANNTTFLITTDHGRGKRKQWTSHGTFISGSSQTWLAIIGPGIHAVGESKERIQLYQQQLAQTIAHLLGEEFIYDSYLLPSLF